MVSDLKPERTRMAQADFALAKIEFFEVNRYVMVMKPRHP
jgi:hypothetical protein